MRSTQNHFLVKTQLSSQAARDTSIARVTGCVYTLVKDNTPLLMPGSTGLTRSALFCARKLYNPHLEGDETRHLWNSVCMHKTIHICYSELTFGVGCLGLPGSYASSFVLPVYVAGQPRSSPGLMLGLLVLSGHDGTCGGRRSLLCSEVISLLLLMCNATAHAHTRYLY